MQQVTAKVQHVCPQRCASPIPSTDSSVPAPQRIRSNVLRASFSSETGRDVVLEGKRKQVFEDVREVRELLRS